MNAVHRSTIEKGSFSSSSTKALQRNNRKKKSSFFSRFTKRQKTTSTKQMLSSLDTMDRMPLNHGVVTSSEKGSIPIMSTVDNTTPSLQSLSSSQSSDDTQSNHEKMQETMVFSNTAKSLYATSAQNLSDLDAEFLEARSDRWRQDGRSFADLESSAQFSMSMDVDENGGTLKQSLQYRDQLRGKKVSLATHSKTSLDTTSDSMPLPVLSFKPKEMVEPTVFELDSSLLSALSAINPVEESFSDESRDSQDKASSDVQELDDDDDDDAAAQDLLEDDDSQEEKEEDDECGEEEQEAGPVNVFSFDYMQERLSCIGCV
ncbi:unnamed protein product [Cylindrotheca closterium]|uniref:Uncharacterized protein n=1 Tax=Cylindrotheca closterium TaxID=2856 RepID=A0AAD2G4I6_9STRA|nr:unnamed protein product [Cylindrotheca closterium]